MEVYETDELRRSETEDTADAADRLIARHRRRKSSVDSSSDVFDSPHRSGSRDRRHDDFSDSDSVTSSASVDRPSRRHIKSERTDIRESRRQDSLSEQEARESIRLMIQNINNLLAEASKDDPVVNDKIDTIKLKKEEEKNPDDSDNDVDDNVFDMEDPIESNVSRMDSKSPDAGVHKQPDGSGTNNNNKPSRDKRKRHNQAVTMEDIQKASKLKGSSDPAPSHTSQKSKDLPPSPKIIEPPVQSAKTSSQEMSPRNLKAGGFKIETVTKTELKKDSSMPKPGDQTVLKRATSPTHDVSKRASWGSNKGEPLKDGLKPAGGQQTGVDRPSSPLSKVTLRKPEIPKVLQDSTRQRKNSDSSISTSESLSVSPTRKVRGGSFSNKSDSEKTGSLQRPKSMPVKDSATSSQSKDQKTPSSKTGGHARVSSSPEKKRLSKTMSSPERKPPKKTDTKASAERKLSSASSTSSSTKSSQVDKRTSYPPAKTTSPDRKPLSRRQSSPEKKLTTRPASPEKKLRTRPASPEKKLTTRQPSPEKKVSKTTGEKKLTRQASSEKKPSRTTSPEKKVSGKSSTEIKSSRTVSPDKRVSKTSPTEKKNERATSPEKRPSTKRTSSPVKKPSVKKDSESKTNKKSPESTKATKDADNKKMESKTNGVDVSKKEPAKSDLIVQKPQVKEEIIAKKEENKEEAVPAAPEPKMPQPVVTIVAPAPDRKPSQAKRIRSRTIEVDMLRRNGTPDPKRDALSTKDDELFAMMQMRAQQIREEEEKEGKVDESGEEEDRSVSEEKPEDVIKVSLKDRMQSFKGKESKPTLVDYSKLPVSPTPKRATKMQPPEKRPEPVNVKQNGEEKKSEDEAEEDDQLAGLSLSEKMKMFTQMSAIRKKAQEEEEKRAKSKSSSRFHRTRGRDRFQTQPVTPEELTTASSLAKEMAAQAENNEESKEKDEDIAREVKKEEVEDTMNTQDRIREEIRQAKLRETIVEEPSEESDDTSSRLPSMAEEEEPPADVQEDEYSKLTLSEKMRLFKEKSTEGTKPPPKVEPPKRKRRSESRFRTQPITVDEVKKAAVSPLAKSFSRPPSVEILGALPIAQQVSMVYGESNATPHPATMNGRSVSSTRRSSNSDLKEAMKDTATKDTASKDTATPKQLPKKEAEVKPQSYKDTVKKQKNLMALLASEIKGTSKEDEEVEHPKTEAVDASIKMARLGHDVTSPTEEKEPILESVETKSVDQTQAARVAASRKKDSVPQKAPPSPKTRHSLIQKQGTSETLSSSKKQLSSPEKKLTKPQPHPRSPQNIRRNGTAKSTKDAAPPSPVPSPRRSKMGSPASMRRQDSQDGDISSGAEDGKRIVNCAAKGSSSEFATPQREKKADQKIKESSSESEAEVRQRVSPVTEEHVALIKKKSKKNSTAEKRDR
ncbi:titin homolog isoform X4 [Lytechinus pictus]|uniref:titin homolog isoform X4 n=1 Tax=Lytechinus pictus TaxID=7653 RepID=UPI0030B9E322